jgi:hypothetical protein
MEIREPKKVTICEQEFPISFGLAAVSYVSEETGLSFKEINSYGEDVPIHVMVKLIYAGLKNGRRRQHKFDGTPQTPFNYGWEDITDMLQEDEEAIEKCMEIWIDSTQQGKGKPKGGKKKGR